MKAKRSLAIIVVVAAIFVSYACSTKAHYTKTISPVPKTVSTIKVVDVKGCCRTDFIRIIIADELSKSSRFVLDDNADYAIEVNVEGYHPSYKRYIALSARIMDLKTDKIIWRSAISGISPRLFIDDLIKNTIAELVKEMSQAI
jgi:hypothetical protein